MLLKCLICFSMKKKTISFICEIVRLIAAAIAGALAGSEHDALANVADIICNVV